MHWDRIDALIELGNYLAESSVFICEYTKHSWLLGMSSFFLACRTEAEIKRGMSLDQQLKLYYVFDLLASVIDSNTWIADDAREWFKKELTEFQERVMSKEK